VGAAYQRLLARLEQTRPLGVSLGLQRMQQALAALGSPERALRAVHIAGTNGKGSTAAMTESILRAAGLRTGLYTSPHLARFTERIRIDGWEIDGDALAALDEQIQATGVALTYFEVATVLAFLAMLQARVDVAVLEVGLGGRLDSTNVCQPVATAITSIALDHTDLLGDTLTAIAAEKAGIAKPGVPLLLGRLPVEADREIARIAAAVGAPVARLGAEVSPAPPRPGWWARTSGTTPHWRWPWPAWPPPPRVGAAVGGDRRRAGAGGLAGAAGAGGTGRLAGCGPQPGGRVGADRRAPGGAAAGPGHVHRQRQAGRGDAGRARPAVRSGVVDPLAQSARAGAGGAGGAAAAGNDGATRGRSVAGPGAGAGGGGSGGGGGGVRVDVPGG
jgi:hypothetical protein